MKAIDRNGKLKAENGKLKAENGKLSNKHTEQNLLGMLVFTVLRIHIHRP